MSHPSIPHISNSLVELPFEIIQQIVSSIDYRPLLFTAALVSKSWNVVVTFLLYRTVVLNRDPELSSFFWTLTYSPYLGKMVEDLHMKAPLNDAKITSLLRCCPSLRRLTLCCEINVNVNLAHIKAIRDALISLSLRYFYIHSEKDRDGGETYGDPFTAREVLEVVARWPELRRLELHNDGLATHGHGAIVGQLQHNACPKLGYVKVGHKGWDNATIDALVHIAPNVNTFILEGKYIRISSSTFVHAFHAWRTTLTFLSLWLGDEWSGWIRRTVMTAISKLEVLKHLDVRSNVLPPSQINRLPPTIQHLIISLECSELAELAVQICGRENIPILAILEYTTIRKETIFTPQVTFAIELACKSRGIKCNMYHEQPKGCPYFAGNPNYY